MLVSGEHVGVVMELEGWGVGQGGGGLVVAWRIFTVLHLDIYLHIYPPHYENTPIQVYRNVHLQKPKITHLITKTRLFKYIEMFTSKNRKFSGKKLWYFFIFLLKT